MNETNERERELEFEENEIVPNYNWLWEMFGYSSFSGIKFKITGSIVGMITFICLKIKFSIFALLSNF